jgi:hypothetical protein
MTLNKGLQLICLISIYLWSTFTLAQDMSGWSDKTLCRLIKNSGDQAYIEEASRRDLVCGGVKKTANTNTVFANEYNTRLHPQYHKDKELIETPLRALKVPTEFKLVDNFTTFMDWHYKNTFDNMRDTDLEVDFQRQFVDPDLCVDDLINTITQKSMVNNASGESDQITTISAKCHMMTSQRFSNNPETGVVAYQRILSSWLEQGTLKKANAYRRKYDQPYDYGVRHSAANLMAHYAVYHELYDFSEEKHQGIVDMFETWVTTYKAYPGTDRVLGSLNVCDLKTPHAVQKSFHATVNGVSKVNQDHCGSLVGRMAVAGVFFGLQFNNQAIFDAGIRYTEIFMAVMDKNSMYSSQIVRGLCAIGYARQMSPIIDQLDYAISKAFGIDFVNMENIHGTTLAKTWLKLYEVVDDPKQLLPYAGRADTRECAPHLTYGRSLSDLVEKNQKRAIAGSFDIGVYTLTAPRLAPELKTNLWRQYNSSSFDTIPRRAFGAGNNAVGISPLVLRKATGWIK